MTGMLARPSLGELMKQHEHEYRRRLSNEDYVLLRLDGRAFHTYTKGLSRPYDTALMEAMDATMVALCEHIQGVRLAYVESDEISLLLTGFKSVPVSEANPAGVQKGELWMGGVEAKLLSLSAALATEAFGAVRRDQAASLGLEGEALAKFHRAPALFDARLWTFNADQEGRALVEKYFTWRRRDSIKNSVTMAALDAFSHRAILGMNTDVKRAKLAEAGSPWEELPAGFRFGRVAKKVYRTEPVTFVHGKTKEVQTAMAERAHWETEAFESVRTVFDRVALPTLKRGKHGTR